MWAWMVVVAMVVPMCGCGAFKQWVESWLPGANFSAAYVVNRDGHYYVGDRCTRGLTDVGVVFGDPHVSKWEEYLDVASWHAVVEDPGVREVEVFASDQSVVSVVFDDGQRPHLTGALYVMSDVGGYWSSIWVALDEIEEGIVATDGVGWVPEDEYWQKPDRDFGC